MKLFNYLKELGETRDSYTLANPALADYLGFGSQSSAGVNVTESSSLGLTAVYRSVSLIAGTIASLPLKSYRRLADDSRERVTTFLDDPGAAVGLTSFEFKEIMMLHLLLHGNAFLFHIYNGAGAIIGLQPIHPSAVSVKVEGGRKTFTLSLQQGGQETYSDKDVTHIMGLSSDGIRGLSPIAATRNALGTSIAGDTAAGKMFANGLMLGGILSSADTVTEEQGQQIVNGFKRNATGVQNAGDIAFVNADLKFNAWTMSAEDAQFLESRSFQVQEVARIFGVPKILLAEDGASTWGSGIAELLRGMQRFTFYPWTTRIEEKLTKLTTRPTYAEFDYAGLLQPSPAEAIANMKMELEAGLLTVDEGRRLLNRPPLPNQEDVNVVS